MGEQKKYLKLFGNLLFFLVVMIVLILLGLYFLNWRNESEGKFGESVQVIISD